MTKVTMVVFDSYLFFMNKLILICYCLEAQMFMRKEDVPASEKIDKNLIPQGIYLLLCFDLICLNK